MKKIVTLDFDMTCFDSWKRFMEIAKEHYPETVVHDDVRMIKEHGFQPALNIANQDIHDIFKREDYYIEGYMIDGFDELYSYLVENGYQINILTVGGALNNYYKSKMLMELGYTRLTFWSIGFMGTSVNFDKGHFDGKGGLFVDDRIKCLDSIDNAVKIRMSYNGVGLDEDRSFKYPVANNLHDVLTYIKMLEKVGD